MARRIWMKQSRQENLIYLAVWGLLFAAPLLSMYVRSVNDPNMEFDWSEVFLVWRLFAVYLLLFLIHNFLLAPMLVHGGRRFVYYASVAAMLMAFTFYQCNQRPERRNHRRPPMERVKHHQPSFAEPPTTFDGERPPLPNDDPLMKGKRPPHRDHKAGPRPPFVGERDILAIVVLVLMFGANLGIKFYYRSRDDQKRLAELEHENLEQQLEYLRYQINPHFFMNTLNNIHALVDIDPEQAKDTILELSKMMRFVLYEGNKKDVPISREFDFIRHYVALMQLRYTEKVKITLDLPQESPDRQIPPLILITFIENAFKHGISYQRESFIDISVAVEGEKLRFKCRNSKADQANEEKGGVGLANVRKRLNLLYDNNYTLVINDTTDIYDVELVIPLKS